MTLSKTMRRNRRAQTLSATLEGLAIATIYILIIIVITLAV